MWCWQPPKTRHHQVNYEASHLGHRECEHIFVAAPFRTIRTDFNGVFACLQCYIAAATHDEEVRCGAGGHSKSAIIRTVTCL